jgi:nitroimidazol reductase NimA-like FMN-containing flavoprotein (pyridoxamine 5'-phosphate oxidase superfamily)
MTEDLESVIRDYIEKHNVARIAVADGGDPSAHSVYYVSHGFHIYFESNPQSQKIHILKANPKISLTIDEDYADWRLIKGVQLFGRAVLTDEKHVPKLQAAFLKKFPHINDIGGIPKTHVFVEVIPEKIVFLDFTKKFGQKSVYYPQDTSSRMDW